MVVPFCIKVTALLGNTPFHKGNEWACNGRNSSQTFSQLIIPIELSMFSKLFSYIVSFIYVQTNLYCIFGHVLMVNSRCYGRCCVKKLASLCTFLEFHTHPEENLVRSFQNVFDKCSKVVNLLFSRNWFFSFFHILRYAAPLKSF